MKNKLARVQERNRPHREMNNEAWLRALPHCLNGTELSWEELRNNLCLRYGLIPQDIPPTCNGFGKEFLI